MDAKARAAAGPAASGPGGRFRLVCVNQLGMANLDVQSRWTSQDVRTVVIGPEQKTVIADSTDSTRFVYIGVSDYALNSICTALSRGCTAVLPFTETGGPHDRVYGLQLMPADCTYANDVYVDKDRLVISTLDGRQLQFWRHDHGRPLYSSTVLKLLRHLDSEKWAKLMEQVSPLSYSPKFQPGQKTFAQMVQHRTGSHLRYSPQQAAAIATQLAQTPTQPPHSTPSPSAPLQTTALLQSNRSSVTSPLLAGVQANRSIVTSPLVAGVQSNRSIVLSPLLAGVQSNRSSVTSPLLAGVQSNRSIVLSPLLAGVKSSPLRASAPAWTPSPKSQAIEIKSEKAVVEIKSDENVVDALKRRRENHGGWPLLVVDDVLTAKECASLILFANEAKFAGTANEYPPEYRNNTRQLWESPHLAKTIWSRLLPLLSTADVKDVRPSGLANSGVWSPVAVNSFFRVASYEKGERFDRHRDVGFCRDDLYRSALTGLIYLNDRFSGGQTLFFPSRPELKRQKKDDIKIQDTPTEKTKSDQEPEQKSDQKQVEEVVSVGGRVGSATVFHHDIEHAGSEVLAGRKIVLRFDVMFYRHGLSLRDLGSEREQIMRGEMYYRMRYLYRSSVLASQKCQPVLATDLFVAAADLLSGTIAKPAPSRHTAGTLGSVAADSFALVAELVGYNGVTKLGCTCRWLKAVVADSALWKHLYTKAWPIFSRLEKALLPTVDLNPVTVPYSIVFRQRLALDKVAAPFWLAIDIGSEVIRFKMGGGALVPSFDIQEQTQIHHKAPLAKVMGATKRPGAIQGGGVSCVPNLLRLEQREVDDLWSYTMVDPVYRFLPEPEFWFKIQDQHLHAELASLFDNPKGLILYRGNETTFHDLFRFCASIPSVANRVDFGSNGRCPPVRVLLSHVNGQNEDENPADAARRLFGPLSSVTVRHPAEFLALDAGLTTAMVLHVGQNPYNSYVRQIKDGQLMDEFIPSLGHCFATEPYSTPSKAELKKLYRRKLLERLQKFAPQVASHISDAATDLTNVFAAIQDKTVLPPLDKKDISDAPTDLTNVLAAIRDRTVLPLDKKETDPQSHGRSSQQISAKGVCEVASKEVCEVVVKHVRSLLSQDASLSNVPWLVSGRWAEVLVPALAPLVNARHTAHGPDSATLGAATFAQLNSTPIHI